MVLPPKENKHLLRRIDELKNVPGWFLAKGDRAEHRIREDVTRLQPQEVSIQPFVEMFKCIA